MHSLSFVTSIGSYLKPTTWFSPSSELGVVSDKVSKFVQKNFASLLLYTAAWAVFIGCTGVLCGFKAVALPIFTGMCAGFAWGGIVGIYVVAVYDKENKYGNYNTFLGAASTISDKVKSPGTRQIVSYVAVPVFFTAAGIFPYAAGGLLGASIGNWTVTCIGYGVDLGIPSTNAIPIVDSQNEVVVLRERVTNLEKEVTNLSALFQNAITKLEGHACQTLTFSAT